jgi:hypothetical protein
LVIDADMVTGKPLEPQAIGWSRLSGMSDPAADGRFPDDEIA